MFLFFLRRKPSELQLEACLREAEKIASLVNTQSPRIASELSLSSLISATIVHTQISINVATKEFLRNELLLLATFVIILTKDLIII